MIHKPNKKFEILFNNNTQPPEGNGDISLLEAAEQSDLKQAIHAISDDPSSINEQDEQGMTALHWAASNRNLAICKLLLESNEIDLSLMDCRGRIALDHALESGHSRIIRLIKDRMYED